MPSVSAVTDHEQDVREELVSQADTVATFATAVATSGSATRVR